MNFCIGYHDNLSTMICQFIFSIFLLPVSSDTPDTAVIHIADFNTTARCACMYNLSVTDIHCSMCDCIQKYIDSLTARPPPARELESRGVEIPHAEWIR